MSQPSIQRNVTRLGKLAAMLGLMLVAIALLMPGVADAAALVDTIVVRYRDDASTQHAATIAVRERQTLGHLSKASVTDAGRTRDGAFRLSIQPPMTIDAARAAINRVRLNPDVLYASIAEGRPRPKSVVAAASTDVQRPVRSLIVKYRDSALVAYADADRVVPRALLQRVANAAGMPMAQSRTMSGG